MSALTGLLSALLLSEQPYPRRAWVETGEGHLQCLVHFPAASGFFFLQAEINCLFHETASARRVSSFMYRSRAPDALLPGPLQMAPVSSPLVCDPPLLLNPFLLHPPPLHQSNHEDTSWCWPDPSSPGSKGPASQSTSFCDH